jgi:hypothetical protein
LSVNGGSPDFFGRELRHVLVPLFVFVSVIVFVVALLVWLVADTAAP